MQSEVDFILSLVERNPNIRGSTIRHRLEKRRKIEALREEREKSKEADKPLWSAFLHLMGKSNGI